DAASYLFVRQQSEPALHLVEPGGAGGREVHVEARVREQPFPDGGGLVGGVVVADQVDVELGGDLLVELGEELLELGGAVAAVQGADDLAGGGVERCEQGGVASAQVVGGPSFGHAGHHRPHLGRAVQRL